MPAQVHKEGRHHVVRHAAHERKSSVPVHQLVKKSSESFSLYMSLGNIVHASDAVAIALICLPSLLCEQNLRVPQKL